MEIQSKQGKPWPYLLQYLQIQNLLGKKLTLSNNFDRNGKKLLINAMNFLIPAGFGEAEKYTEIEKMTASDSICRSSKGQRTLE